MTLQSCRGQPVVCLVYTVTVRSQFTYHLCSNTAVLWPCCESALDAAVSQRDISLEVPGLDLHDVQDMSFFYALA